MPDDEIVSDAPAVGDESPAQPPTNFEVDPASAKVGRRDLARSLDEVLRWNADHRNVLERVREIVGKELE